MLFSIAATLGKWSGIIAAESLCICENGFRVGVAYYAANASIQKVSEIATQHAIDSNNSEKVTENLFDCLEFID
jgi:hypothetical protein